MKPKVLFAGSSKSRLMPALAVALATITTGHAQLLVDGTSTVAVSGTYSATSGDSGIRNGGTLTVNSGVNVIVNNGGGSWFGIGDFSGSSLLRLNGGSMTINSNWGTVLGRSANGTITIDSGSLTVNKAAGNDNGILIGEMGGKGEINLNSSGTLTTYKISSAGAVNTHVFNFNGGTLTPTVSKVDWFADTGNILTQVRNGGAKIDTAGFDVTIGEQLVHSTIGGDNAIDGGLTKNGAGTLALSGANSYTGTTTLASGTLAAGNNSAFGSGALAINGGTLTNIGLRTITNAISGTGGNIAAAAFTDFNVNGNITGNGSFVLSGILNQAGLLLGGDNSGFTGTFTVTGANTRLNSASAGSAAAKWVVEGNLQLNVAGTTTYHLGELSSTVATGGISGHATNGTATVSTLSVGALNTSSEFKGVIANMPANNAATGNLDGASNNVLALTKVGNGTLTLSGASTYTGDTIVSAGTLLVSGSLGDTAVTVNSGAKLGGTGTVGTANALKIFTVNGELSPGNSAGILTVNDNLDLNGALTMELNGITAGSSYDQVVLNGAGELGGNLSLMWGLTSAPAINTELLLILNDGSDAFTGAFTNAANLSNHTDNLGGSWQLRYTGGDGNDLSLVAVPEPRAALLGGLGLLALLRRRRH